MTIKMGKPLPIKITSLILGFLVSFNVCARVPAPPQGDAKAYALMDYNSGQLLASSNPHERLDPASLTKMMTMYVIDNELQEGRVKPDTLVHISKNAWQAQGSRMFVEVDTDVKVDDLVRGIIVQSGNDACIALAEHLAGTEEAFVNLMNEHAKRLGMNNTHFQNATGLPNPDHFTTAYDLGLLSVALIKDFPESYKIHSEKWFTFQGIKQPNRNRLLWRENFVDGIKTGHSSTAGYCLAASGEQNGMRIVSIVLGSDNDNARTDFSQRLLRFGFRFYETHQLYAASKAIKEPKVWMGASDKVGVGLKETLYITVPQGTYKELKATVNLSAQLTAPITKGASIGKLFVKNGDEIILEKPLIALNSVAQGSLWSRFSDYVSLKLQGVVGTVEEAKNEA